MNDRLSEAQIRALQCLAKLGKPFPSRIRSMEDAANLFPDGYIDYQVYIQITDLGLEELANQDASSRIIAGMSSAGRTALSQPAKGEDDAGR